MKKLLLSALIVLTFLCSNCADAEQSHKKSSPISKYQSVSTWNEDIIIRTNIDRIANGLKPLAINSQLMEVARLKAEDMKTDNYFAHISFDGKSPWYWFQNVGYRYRYAGENLAKDFKTSAGAHNALMQSPGHRQNLLSNKFCEIGVQTVTLTSGEILVVEEFGCRKR